MEKYTIMYHIQLGMNWRVTKRRVRKHLGVSGLETLSHPMLQKRKELRSVLRFGFLLLTGHQSLLLLVRDTNSASTTTSRLGVLTTDTEAPIVTETTVRADTLEALEVLTELVVETVGEDLGSLSVLGVLLSVQEPGGDLVVHGVLQDLNNLVDLLSAQLSSTATEVNLGLAASEGRQTTSNSTNGGEGNSNLLATINVRVEDTNNVLEGRLLENSDG